MIGQKTARDEYRTLEQRDYRTRDNLVYNETS